MSDTVANSRAGMALDAAGWRECVQAAIAAPSICNTQPWLFLPRGDSADVFIDTRRRLLRIDPTGREMHVSVGAAVYNLLTALVARGFRVQTLLTPVPADPRLVARIRLIGRLHPSPRAARLLAVIPTRRTSRRPFHEVPGAEVLDELAAAARAEGATLEVLDPAEREALFALIRTAETRLRRDSEYVAELARWTTDNPVRRNGVHTDAFGVSSEDDAVPVRDFAVGRPGVEQQRARYEVEPVVLALTTTGDDPEHWLRAGMALERVLLEATSLGVAVAFMTQPLELPELRELYDERWLLQSTQMILRVGYAEPSPPVARRALDEVIIKSEDEVPPLPR